MANEPSNTATATENLLVMTAGEEVAKRIENSLRNNGHAIRALWVTSLSDVEDTLRDQPCGLLLHDTESTSIDAKDCVMRCSQLAPDMPVILMSAQRPPIGDLAEALTFGAHDFVGYDDAQLLKHLESVCLREMRAHATVRNFRSSRARLADYEIRHKKLVSGTADAVVKVSEGIVTQANAAFAALLGFHSMGDLLAHPVMDLVPADHQAALKKAMKVYDKDGDHPTTPLPLHLKHQDGRVLELKAQVTVGSEGGDRILEWLIRPERGAARPAKAKEAEAPPETPPASAPVGALAVYDALEKAGPGKEGALNAVFAVRIDDFDHFQDRIGIRNTEEIIGQVTALTEHLLGDKALAIRFATAEIVGLGVAATVPALNELAEELRKDLAAKLFKTKERETQLSVSIACYPLSEQEDTVTSLETAIHEARKLSQSGGNRSQLYGPLAKSAKQRAEEQARAQQVKSALEKNRLKLAFQSIASLEGEQVFHYDVLVRLLGDDGKEILARDFIPAAEKFGLISAVDRSVVTKSLAVLAKRASGDEQSSLFVRLSEKTLVDGELFCKWLADQLKRRPLRKEELVISVQEQLIEAHMGKATALFKALNVLGVDIAIDHFGMSANSAKLLDMVKAQFVRFHFSFTKNFNDEATQRKFVSLMERAKSKNVRSIAGHVEDANIMARLWQLGVNYIQGYHIQEPEAALQATDLRS